MSGGNNSLFGEVLFAALQLQKILLRTRGTHWIAYTVNCRILQPCTSTIVHFQVLRQRKKIISAVNNTSLREVLPSGNFEKYCFLPAESIG